MYKYRILIMLISLGGLAGCEAMKPTTGHTSSGEVAYYQAQAQNRNAKLVDITCPPTGCSFASLTVYNPSEPNVQQLRVADPMSEAVKVGGNLLNTVAKYGAAAYVFGKISDMKVGDNINTTTTTTTTSSSSSSTSGDTFGDGANIIGGDNITDSNNSEIPFPAP